MKYTERFFEFSARIYDSFRTIKALEEANRTNVPTGGDWCEGKIKLPFQEITSYEEYFDSEQGVAGAVKDGMKNTLVWTKNEGVYICTWPKKKFEERLDAYVQKYEDWANQQLEWHVHRLQELQQPSL